MPQNDWCNNYKIRGKVVRAAMRTDKKDQHTQIPYLIIRTVAKEPYIELAHGGLLNGIRPGMEIGIEGELVGTIEGDMSYGPVQTIKVFHDPLNVQQGPQAAATTTAGK